MSAAARAAAAVVLAWLAAAAVLFTPARARAAGPAGVEVTAIAEPPTIGVGDPVRVTLSAQSRTGASAEDPELGPLPAGLAPTSGRPSVSSQTSVSISNGVMTQTQGIRATWVLSGTRVGTFTLRPSASFDGRRATAPPVTIIVVPAGRAPRATAPGFDPLDPWKGLFGGNPFDSNDDFFGGNLPTVPTDPKLALDAPRGRGAFLHAVVDKTSAVVGEQVTLSIYMYADVDDREPDFNDVHEATTSDFAKHPLVDENENPRTVGNARVAGRVWAVKLVRKQALFPLKAGDLVIGPMKLGVAGGGGVVTQRRESETITVHVGEPPIAGRPPGYVVGDVGKFQLSATVAPRSVERGGAIAVDIELSGTGNVPASITPPARAGLEWLPPEVHEKLGPTSDGRFGGSRTFSFVVRPQKEGSVDLGTIALPFWDPDARAYATASAPLGVVEVKPGAVPESDAGAGAEPLSGMPAPRTTLSAGGAVSARSHLADRSLFWWLLAAPPLAWAFAAGGRAAGGRLRGMVRARTTSPSTALKQRVSEAAAACKKDDARAADAAVARAVFTAIEVRAGVNVRAAPTGEIVERLGDAGVDTEIARELAAVLAECESARFSPDGADVESARGRWARAKAAIDRLKSSGRASPAKEEG